MNQPWHAIWGYDKEKTPNTSFTIGIDTPEVVKQKTKEAEIYKVLKVKLGRDTDKEMIEAIRSVTDTPLTVDINQGWTDKNFALEMINWLKERNVEFVEQPMPKEQVDDIAWLTENSPLPVIADESIQRLPDVIKAHGVYSGINIKLMKCTGMREAHKMLTLAKSLGMKVMLGCMTETSCAISAAAQLSPMADWADLDGNLLIKNDPYEGVKVVDGKIVLSDKPGIGLI
jgi:L-alanine-DL-glutamate epimerase-like enolase superfamily enzyme